MAGCGPDALGRLGGFVEAGWGLPHKLREGGTPSVGRSAGVTGVTNPMASPAGIEIGLSEVFITKIPTWGFWEISTTASDEINCRSEQRPGKGSIKYSVISGKTWKVRGTNWPLFAGIRCSV